MLQEMTHQLIMPDVVSYSATISACGKGEQWVGALELLQEMPRRALQPDVISCDAAISACEKGM